MNKRASNLEEPYVHADMQANAHALFIMQEAQAIGVSHQTCYIYKQMRYVYLTIQKEKQNSAWTNYSH